MSLKICENFVSQITRALIIIILSSIVGATGYIIYAGGFIKAKATFVSASAFNGGDIMAVIFVTSKTANCSMFYWYILCFLVVGCVLVYRICSIF